MKVSRRNFVLGSGAVSIGSATAAAAAAPAAAPVPWYARSHRWAQTNIPLKDVAGYDVAFWRKFCERTAAQVVIANGAAGFATFPSRNPLISTSPFAPTRDLLGEIAKGAAADGMFLAARMDSSVLNPKIIAAYPDWLTRDAAGKPGTTMCINSPYRQKHVYPLYQEIVERYHVAGFTDNAGVTGGPLCYCKFCTSKFAAQVGGPLPKAVNLDDPRYRAWRRWNTSVTMAAWEETNVFTRSVGGPDCIYVGLVRKFAPLNREIATRANVLLMDCQSRNDSGSFQEHVDDGRFMRSLIGWDKNVSVASSMTQHSHGYFRLTTEPLAEVSLYTKSGLAGGFNPWWHYPTACSDDARSYEIPVPIFQWYARNEGLLNNGTPVATAAILYSDDNAQFFGRDAPGLYQPGNISEVTQVPYRGISRALSDRGVSYFPFHTRDIARHAAEAPVLVLPNLGGLSDAECAAIRDYVRNGGSLVATGMTSLFDDDGEPRRNFALADVLGVTVAGAVPKRTLFGDADAESYIRFAEGPRHPALAEFADTDVLAYGGTVLPVKVAADRQVLASFVAEPGAGKGGAPAIVVGSFGKGRVAFLPIDLDRRYLRDGNHDHAALLAALVRWCARDAVPFEVSGPGRVGTYLYRSGGRFVLHLLNGSGSDNGDEMTGQLYPMGPLRVRIAAPATGKDIVRLLVGNTSVTARRAGGFVEFTVPRVDDYQVAVLE